MTINLTFKRQGEYAETHSVSWTDDRARYHVWIRANGRPEDTIYMNPLIRPDGTYPNHRDPDHFSTRTLNLRAAKHKATRDAINTAIRHGALDKANEAMRAEQAAVKAAQTAKLVKDRRATLTHIGKITGVPALVEYAEDATDEQIADLPSFNV